MDIRQGLQRLFDLYGNHNAVFLRKISDLQIGQTVAVIGDEKLFKLLDRDDKLEIFTVNRGLVICFKRYSKGQIFEYRRIIDECEITCTMTQIDEIVYNLVKELKSNVMKIIDEKDLK